MTGQDSTAPRLGELGEGGGEGSQSRAARLGRGHLRTCPTVMSEGLIVSTGFRATWAVLSEGSGSLFLPDTDRTCWHLLPLPEPSSAGLGTDSVLQAFRRCLRLPLGYCPGHSFPRLFVGLPTGDLVLWRQSNPGANLGPTVTCGAHHLPSPKGFVVSSKMRQFSMHGIL